MLRDDLNTESQTRTPKYSPIYVRANDLARSDKFSLLRLVHDFLCNEINV